MKTPPLLYYSSGGILRLYFFGRVERIDEVADLCGDLECWFAGGFEFLEAYWLADDDAEVFATCCAEFCRECGLLDVDVYADLLAPLGETVEAFTV